MPFRPRLSPSRRRALLIAALALTLAACGRKGDPLPPPDPTAPRPSPTATKSVFLPGGGYSSERPKPVTPTDKSLPIDSLLK